MYYILTTTQKSQYIFNIFGYFRTSLSLSPNWIATANIAYYFIVDDVTIIH